MLPSLITPSGISGITNNELITTTNPTVILSYTPKYNDLIFILIGLEEIIQSQINLVVNWESPDTGAQNYTWENDVIPYGPRFQLPVLLIAKAGTEVTVTITSNVAKAVYAIALLLDMLPIPVQVS